MEEKGREREGGREGERRRKVPARRLSIQFRSRFPPGHPAGNPDTIVR